MTVLEKLMLAGPQGQLEAVLECNTETPRFMAVVAHPHPLFGGTMDNKVVTTLVRACRDGGGAALRFNFRGVGASQGAFDEGRGESEDLLAVVSWLQHRYPTLPLWLAGFSFGSYVAAHGAELLSVNGSAPRYLLLVAPPVHHYPFTEIESIRCPVTVLQGDEDEVVPSEQVFQWAADTPLSPDVIRFPGTGHFFHGHLTELKHIVAQSLAEYFDVL